MDEKKREKDARNTVEGEFSLQKDTFAPGENSYLNEYPGRSIVREGEDTADTEDHEFSEELSDGGERNEYINKQTGRNCGGL